jgi:hypothetical protein
LQLRQSDIAVLVSREVGMPFAYRNVIHAGLPVLSFVSMAELALACNSVNLFRRPRNYEKYSTNSFIHKPLYPR